MKMQDMMICSKAYRQNSEGIAIGSKIAMSPIKMSGTGILTDITAAGYPRVDHVAVTCMISEDGLFYGDVRQYIEKYLLSPILDKKAVKVVFFYKGEDGIEHQEGTGPIPDIKFPDSANVELRWNAKINPENKIDGDLHTNVAAEELTEMFKGIEIVAPVTINDDMEVTISEANTFALTENNYTSIESTIKQNQRKQRSLEIASDQLGPIFKNYLIDPARDKAAEEITNLLANWIETAAQHLDNEQFYHNIVTQIGEMFGQEAKTSDDGSIQEDVLALKVPELVKELKDKSVRLECDTTNLIYSLKHEIDSVIWKKLGELRK